MSPLELFASLSWPERLAMVAAALVVATGTWLLLTLTFIAGSPAQ